mmetsp:Transcript_30790/g.59345  ORF Transcript_30790/g.59345 Transcript_30790/m.59345 type:complete len:407 (-) Transcript_30790:201-1421(-)
MEEDGTKSYRIKDIKFFGSARRILLQSANGPCPLLALCNVLLLRNQLQISQDARYISFDELVAMVTNQLFDANASATRDNDASSPTGSRAANVRESLSSCLEVLPRLNVGLDVNCKFGGVSDFEYTQELSVFDLLDICLYHGWLVSQQEEKAWALFAHLSYNQVVERLIAYEEAQQRVANSAEAAAPPANSAGASSSAAAASTEEADSASSAAAALPDAAAASGSAAVPPDAETQKAIEEGLLIKDFMDRTASQLSYDGLMALHETLRERQLAVFFRNSHFSTMLKYSGDLYLLCTDIAFGYSHIVWEKLDEVDGDTTYYDADFQPNTAESAEAAALAAAEAAQESYLAGAVAMGPPQQADADAMLAWQMMQEDAASVRLAIGNAAAAVGRTKARELRPRRRQAQG